MKKFLLMLSALLLIGGGTVSATKKYADLSKIEQKGGHGFWDNDTKTLSWTSSTDNLCDLPDLVGNWSKYTSINLETSDLVGSTFRLWIYLEGEEEPIKIGMWGAGPKNLSFTRSEFIGKDLSKVTRVCVGGNAFAEGAEEESIVISEVYLDGPDMAAANARERDLTANLFNNNCDEAVLNKDLGGGALIYGDAGVFAENYADLSEYDKLVLVTEGELTPRLLFNRVGPGANGDFIELVGSKTDENKGWIVEENKYTVDLKKIVENNGYAHLNVIKTESVWDGRSVTVKEIVLHKDTECEYAISGGGEITPEVEAILTDETVKIIDATGLIGVGYTLTSENPNCIFFAKEGVLDNESNVYVNGTIANLVVTDGYPMAVPANTTAKEASYSRTMANTFGTICLPYAVESTDAVKFYTLGELKDDVLTLEETTKLEAGVPAIVEKIAEGNETISVVGAGKLAAAGETADALTMIGSYEEKTILAGDDAIYAISNNQFVQATQQINLPAFRAYVVAENGAPAKIRLVVGDDDATAIGSVAEGNATVEGIYSVNGAEQKSLQKGINIIKLSNGKVQKVLVK